MTSWTHFLKCITAFLILVFGYAACGLRCHVTGSVDRCRNNFKRISVVLFCIYLFAVIDFTLIDRDFGRHLIHFFGRDFSLYRDYIRQNTNNVPFRTVALYVRGFKDGNLTFLQMIENLLGNFAVLIPFALLLPMISAKFHRFLRFFSVMLIGDVLIEVLQLAFLTGSSDVDDLILNISGACIAFGVFHLPRVSAWLSKRTYGLWGKKYEK